MKSLSELNKLFTLKEFNNLGKKFEKEVASSECWNSFSDLVIQYLTLSAEIKECNRLIKTHKESIADFARKMMNCFLYRILALPNGLIPKFQHELKSKGLLTFDGMIKHTAQALQESSQKKELICSLQETYKYGVIDEFQDTTHEQWEIFKTIFLDDKNVDRNVLVVGDPKQSIYSFQGAEIKTCLDAVEEIEEMNLKISNFKLGEQRTKESIETSADKEKYLGRYELDTNYRSSEKLIRGYDELFTNDKWFGGESKTTGLNEKYSGVMAGETPKDITDNNTPAMSILDFSEYTDSNNKPFKPNVKKSIVTKWAVAQIVKLLEQGVDPSEIAILGQRRSEYKEIVLKLKDLKIPVSLTKEEGLFQGELALELLICLEGIIYQDTASKHKAFLTRFFGLEPQDMIGVSDEIGETIYGAHYNKSQSNIERLKGIAKVGKWGILFRKLWDDFQQDEISYSLDRAAYRQIVSYILKSIYDKGMTLEVVTRQLRSLYKGDLKESKEENSYQRETSSAAIQAMTLHASKGLEFPYVLIPSGLSTHFKTKKSDFLTMISEGRGQKYYLDTAAVEKKKELNELEWMRLFYVGYTRPEKWIGFPWYCISGASKTPAVQFLDASIKGSSKEYVELVNPGDVLEVTNNSQINISVKKASNELQGDKSIKIPQGPQRLRDTESFNNKNPRPSDRTSVQTSFTSLSKIKGFDEPDLLDSTLLTLNTNVQNELWNPLAKNASTGLLIHEVLEKTDFRIFHPELYTTTEAQNEFNLMTWRENILIPKLKQHQPGLLNNKDKESQQTSLDSMQTIFYQILNTDLQLQGLVLPQESASFKLSQLAPMDAVVRMMVETHPFEIGTYHAEPEFWFPYDKDGNTNWDSKTDQVKAWVLGFIDLLFEIQGNYYILDWKTNTLSDYSDKSIAKSMKEHKYHWQAALYSKAVSEWLKGFDPDAVSHKVAGAVYFYVRGCGDQGSMPLWQNTVEGLIRDFEAGVQPAMKELVQTKPNQSNILNSEDLIDV
jgi:exodeoxyribonuclease V beta subunit